MNLGRRPELGGFMKKRSVRVCRGRQREREGSHGREKKKGTHTHTLLSYKLQCLDSKDYGDSKIPRIPKIPKITKIPRFRDSEREMSGRKIVGGW